MNGNFYAVKRIFIATPSDLTEERKIFLDMCNEVNENKAHSLGIHINALGWEDALPGIGRPQELINRDILCADLFICMFWKRWGTATGEYSSGTEEEFAVARQLNTETGKPEIMVFFKEPVDIHRDEYNDLKRIEVFRKKIEDERILLFQEVKGAKDWEHKLRKTVYTWLDRVYKETVEKSPLGERPDLQPRRILHKEQDDMGGFKVPNLRKVTDADKNRFMRSSFHEIKGRLTTILESTKAANDNFDFHQDDITSRKSIFKMYIDGSQKCAIKIWLGNAFGGSTDSINLSYGNSVSDSDNSVNEIIICEVDKDKELKLKMTLSMFGNRTAGEPAHIVKEIWDTVMPYLR